MIRKPLLVLLPAFVLLLLGGINVARKISWVEPTDGVTWADRAGGVIAVRVEPSGPADLGGVKAGDILYSIGKSRVRSNIDVIRDLWQAYGRGDKVVYEINRDGTLLYPSFYLQKKALPLTYFYLVGVGVITIVLALLVMLGAARSLSPPYIFFYILSLAFAAFFILSPTGALDTQDMVFYAVDKAAFVLFPPLLYHFFLTFPVRRRAPRERRLRPAFLYVPAVLLLLARVAYHLPWMKGFSDIEVLRFRMALDRLELLQLAVFSLAALALVMAGGRRTSSVLVQKQLRLIGTGLGLGILPFTILYVLPFLAGRTPSPVAELSVLLEVLVPLTFAYAISRHKARDFESMLKKAVTLAFSFFVIATLYFVVSTQTRIFSENKINVIVLGVLAMFLGATLFTPLKKLFQTLLDRAIYRRSYEYRKTLLLISKELSRERNLQTLSASLLEAMANALSLRSIALLLAGDKDPLALEVLSARGEAQDLPRRLALDEAASRLLREKEYLSFDAYEDRRPVPAALAPLTARGLFHLLPLSVEDKMVGCLVMGRKSDGSFFTADDWVLLTTVSPSVALALENAYLYSRETVRALEMQRLKDYSENIIESLTVGVAVTDQDGRVIGWNRVLEGVFGMAKADVLGKPLGDALGPANSAALFPPDTQQDYRLLSEISLETPGGERRIFDIARTPLLDNSLQPYGTITVFEDTTEKIRLQQQLLTSEKLASIGLLSAGVAHEINTPLTGISSYIQMLQKRLTDPHYVQILGKIEVQTDRVARIIKNLLTFARSPAEAAFHRVDLKESLEEIVSLIDYKLRTLNIELEMRLQPVPPLYAQGERLQQVFINIILNALDAMPAGGRLTIELLPRGREAVVRITDTGTGIRPEHLPHIFDPFFTTKGIGKGTGLGLSISYAIVREHEGQIHVESEIGKGTAFTIAIPGDLDRRKAGPPAEPRT